MTSELFDESSHMENQIQGFEPTNNEEFHFTTGMEMIGFGKKNFQQQQSEYGCKGFSENTTSQLPGPSSSSRITSTAWHESGFIDETNYLSCMPSQSLSLSLYSSSLGLQGQVIHHSQGHQHDDMRFVTFNNRAEGFPYDQNVDGVSWKSPSFHQGEIQLRKSQYLGPAQDLLQEFCSLGTKQKANKKSLRHWEDQEQDIISSILGKQSLHSLDSMELHRRKLRLLSMLEEVDRRYKRYLDQMKSVVSAFEDVVGSRSADLYTAFALNVMSKHFRCLRDAIVNQIQETKKFMEDKNKVVAGTSRGEMPRLRAVDQSFRRQMALQQRGIMESHPWRPQRGLPERSVSLLRAWLFEHFLHPYPTDVDKHILSRQTALSKSQVSNWFINARVRLWKPMVEEIYVQELKERENTSSERAPEDINGQPSHQNHHEDEKPQHEQLAPMDSACLPSNIIITSHHQRPDDENSKTTFQNQNNNMQHQDYGRLEENFGAMDLDFYNHNFNSPAGVSLTLGLQQHEGSLAFSPTEPENSLFYPRNTIEDFQPVQYSLIDHETHNLPL